jgi:glycosyltransferase involved in cell wall biosynthesis
VCNFVSSKRMDRIAIQWQARRFYPDLYGGLEVLGYQTVKALHAMGHDLSVLTENYPAGPLVHDEPIPGIPCTRIPTAGTGIFWRIAPWARVARWAFCQRKYARGAEIVIATHPECVIAGKIALPKRHVVYNCETVTAAAIPSHERTPLQTHQIRLERLAARMANRVTVPSENTKRQLLDFVDLPEQKVRLVPHGIDYPVFAEAKPAPQLVDLKRRGFFVVLYVGRLHHEKGVDLAIDILSRMKHREQTRLVFVGEGPEEHSLRVQAAKTGVAEHIVFTGKVANPETYVAAADALILPSRQEAFGIVLLEAMAAGRPCVAWANDPPIARVACSEIIVDGQTGYCVRPFDLDEFADRLDWLAADKALRQRMGQAAQLRCRTNYSWQHTAELYLELATINIVEHSSSCR